MIVVLLVGTVAAQTYVPPGDGTLSTAIAASVDGDILELVPEGVYTESAAYLFGTIVDKSITIRVEGEESPMAKLQILTPPDGVNTIRFFDVGNNASLALRDLEFDGGFGGVATVEHGVSYYLGEVPVFTTVNKIRVEGCYFHDLVGSVLYAGSPDQRANLLVDSTFVNDVIMENIGTSIYYKYCGANYISLTNSTINTTSSYGFRVSGPGESNMPNNTPSAFIDHTTWFNIGTVDSREVIQVEKGPNLGNWTFTNSICQQHINKDRTAINIKDTAYPAEVHNICLWDIGKTTWSGSSHNINVSDTLSIDPAFADPGNGDFTLPAGSQLLSYGTDGGPIGDMRWAGNASSAVGEQTAAVPTEFELSQNFPNPFNPSTSIHFSLDEPGLTTLTVFDLLGNEVRQLINGHLAAGVHLFTVDATDLPSGIYYYRLRSAGRVLTQKMTLLR